MASGANASGPAYGYEYYLDYLDPVPVDEQKLRAHKHTVVIAFWVGLAAFVVLLFLVLLCMSWGGSLQARYHARLPPTCPWSLRLNLPLCFRRRLLLPRAPQAPLRPAKEPGHRAPGPPVP